jgi:hypothetical protein
MLKVHPEIGASAYTIAHRVPAERDPPYEGQYCRTETLMCVVIDTAAAA